MKNLMIVSLIFLCDLHNTFAKNPRDLIPENQKMIYGAALTDSSIVAGWNISDEDLKYALQPFKILRISIGQVISRPISTIGKQILISIKLRRFLT